MAGSGLQLPSSDLPRATTGHSQSPSPIRGQPRGLHKGRFRWFSPDRLQFGRMSCRQAKMRSTSIDEAGSRAPAQCRIAWRLKGSNGQSRARSPASSIRHAAIGEDMMQAWNTPPEAVKDRGHTSAVLKICGASQPSKRGAGHDRTLPSLDLRAHVLVQRPPVFRGVHGPAVDLACRGTRSFLLPSLQECGRILSHDNAKVYP